MNKIAENIATAFRSWNSDNEIDGLLRTSGTPTTRTDASGDPMAHELPEDPGPEGPDTVTGKGSGAEIGSSAVTRQ